MVLFLLTGLRKLEAFFGFLITIMALTFGYEVPSPPLSALSPELFGDTFPLPPPLLLCPNSTKTRGRTLKIKDL